MPEEAPRQSLVLQRNPQPSIEASILADEAALTERLSRLPEGYRISAFEMLGGVLSSGVREMLDNPSLDSVQRTALNGLVEALDKKFNRLEAKRIHH